MIRAVTFDATGTLFHCPRLGGVYAEVLARHGIDVSAARAGELIREIWTEFDCAVRDDRDRFAAHPDGPRGFWRRFLERFCEHLGVPAATPFAAAELYDRFARAAAWELYEDVAPTLEALAAEDLTLAVIANWDPRLPGLLEELGIAGRFAEIVYSAEVGFEKPHPGIFESALARLAVEPEEVLHVGDDRRRDVEGAQALGMNAVLLDRSGAGEIRSLGEVRGAAERLWYVAGGAT